MIFTGRNEVLAKVIFLHLFVILFTGGGVPDQVHPPPGPGTPPRTRYTPPTRYPPGPGTPPLGPGTPPHQDQVHPPPGSGTPPRAANSGIRSTIGWYASYCNAFLLLKFSKFHDISRSSRCILIFPGFQGRVETLWGLGGGILDYSRIGYSLIFEHKIFSLKICSA